MLYKLDRKYRQHKGPWTPSQRQYEVIADAGPVLIGLIAKEIRSIIPDMDAWEQMNVPVVIE